jgi:hypothetical protein
MGQVMRTVRSVIVWTGFAMWGATALSVWMLPAKVVVAANSGMVATTGVAYKKTARDKEALRFDNKVLIRAVADVTQRRDEASRPRCLQRVKLAFPRWP